MQNKYVLDTSFLSSLLNEKDVNYELAKEIASNFELPSEIIVPSVVLAELATFSKEKDLSKGLIKSTLEITNNIVDLKKRNIKKYLYLIHSLKNTITALDSIILFIAISNNAELITFDKKLEKIFKSLFN